jgi:hypothetical protein
MSVHQVTVSVGEIVPPTLAETDKAGCGSELAKGCWARATTFVLPVGVATLIARADPSRGRIGFTSRSADPVIVSTVADPASLFGMDCAGPGILWLTPSDAAQLVTFDWYAWPDSINQQQITVFEAFSR